MLVAEESKEKVFAKIDEFIDRGIDVMNLSSELSPREYETFRTYVKRNFGGSITNALIEYGLFDSNGTPTPLELHRCLYINECYKVCINEYKKAELMDLYNLDEVLFRRLIIPIIRNVELEALDEFYRNEFPNNIKHTFFEQAEYKHLHAYLANHYSQSITDFLNFYGTPSEIFVTKDYNRKAGKYIKAGFQFETLIKEALIQKYSDVAYQKTIGNCKPDFIINKNMWVDAKLGRWTVFHRQSYTIKKYLKHTNHLTIYFAFGDKTEYHNDYLSLLHVSTLYKHLSYDLVNRIELFIETHAELYEKEAINT